MRRYLTRLKGEKATAFDSFLFALQRGVSGTLVALSKGDTEVGKAGSRERPSFFLHCAGIAYDFLQFYAFAIFPLLGWGKIPAVGWLLSVFRVRNPFQVAISLGSALGPATTALAWLALAIFVVCVCLTVRGFATGKFDSVLPLRIVRATADYVVLLQITLVERLAAVFTCGTVKAGVWSATAISCSGGTYALIVAATALVMLLFLLFSTVVAAVSFNRDYRAGAVVYSRRALGRVEAVMMVLRTLLTLLFTNASALSTPLLLVASVATGLLFVSLYLRYLPELAAWRNKLMCCLGAAFCFTTLCSIPAVMLPEEDAASWRPLLAVVFYVGLPGSVALAFIAVSARLAAAAADPATPAAMALAQPTDVEVVARTQVARALADAAPPRVAPAAGAPGAPAAGSAGGALDIALARAVAVLQRGSSKLFPGSALMDCLHANFIRGNPRAAEVVDYAPFLAEVRSSRAAALRGGRRAAGGGKGAAARLMSEEESVAAFFLAPAPQAPPPAPFPPALEVEMVLLNAGLTKATAVDVRFLLSQARAAAASEQFEAAEAAAATLRGEHRWERQRLTAVQEVQKEQLVVEASVSTVRAMAAQLRLWRAAAAGGGGGGETLLALSARLSELSFANRGALGALAYLRALAPGSSAALLAQGSYLLGVVGDARGAAAAFSRGAAALAEEEKVRLSGGEEAGGHARAGEAAEASVGLLVPASAASLRALARAEGFNGGGGDEDGGGRLPQLAETLSAALRALPVSGGGGAAPPPLATRVGSPFPTGGAKAAREPFYAPLRLRARLVLALAVALYGAAVGVTQAHGAALGRAAGEVLASGDRQLLMSRMARLAFRGAAGAAGALRPAPGGADAFTFNSTLSGLAFDAEALKALHRPLFSSARASALAEEVRLYTSADAVPMRAMSAGGGGEAAYTSSLGDAVMAFAASAAALAPLGALPPPVGANFSLAGAPEGAFFLVANMGGGLGAAAARATALLSARLAAAGAEAAAAVTAALLAALLVPLLAAAALLLPPLASARAEVEAALSALPAAPAAALAGLLAHPARCFHGLLGAAAGDEKHLFRLLTDQAGLRPEGAEEVVACARVGGGGAGGDAAAGAEGEGAAPFAAAAPRRRCAPPSPSPRGRLLARALAPLALLLLFSGACLGFALQRLAAVAGASEAAAAFAALRSALPPPTAEAQAALTGGLSEGLWRSPLARANASGGGSPPACSAPALRAAVDAAAASSRAVGAALDAAVAAGTTFPDPALPALLLGGACEAVAGGHDGGGELARGGWDLGLPPLDCRGGVAAGAPTTGAFFGSGGNGLAGAVRAHAALLVELLQRRAAAVAGGGGALESASLLLAGATAAVVAPAAPAAGGAWPCAPPLLEQPGRAWLADAVLQQLVEPSVRLALGLVLAWQAGALAALQVVQSVTAAVMPLLAAALYYTALLPAINELDDQQKLGKWLSAKAGSA